jgi:hypothetical protein
MNRGANATRAIVSSSLSEHGCCERDEFGNQQAFADLLYLFGKIRQRY